MIIRSLSFKDLPQKQSATSNAHALGVIEIRSRLNGTYDAIKKFLMSLEINARIVDVEKLSMESNIKTDKDLIDVVVVARTYYQLDK